MPCRAWVWGGMESRATTGSGGQGREDLDGVVRRILIPTICDPRWYERRAQRRFTSSQVLQAVFALSRVRGGYRQRGRWRSPATATLPEAGGGRHLFGPRPHRLRQAIP